MKCKVCEETKTLDKFVKHKNYKTGRMTTCKSCWATAQKKYRQENIQTVRATERNSKRKTYKPEIERQRKREAYKTNPTKFRKRNLEWYYNNKEKVFDSVASRNRRRKEATPRWLTKEQRLDILQMYRLKRKLSKLLGVDYEVDHIVPLQGKNVCGLHVPWNLQLLEKSLNRSKGNSYV